MDSRYGGYKGKLLRVNLTKSSCKTEELDFDLLRRFIGGRGLGAALLYQELSPGIDPLSADNKLIFLTGPLVGTATPCSARWSISTKSPETGIILFSICSGMFGTAIKKAGYDVIVIEGKASRPSFLLISDKEFSIKDASDIWGMTTEETEESIQKKISAEGKFSVVSIGPAGEKQIKIAGVFSNRRAAGRGGAGAVMGSKNLKAIAARGTTKISFYDEDKLRVAIKKFRKNIEINPFLQNVLSKYGSASTVNITGKFGVMPIRNWQKATMEGFNALRPETMREKFLVKDKACPTCPVGCSKITAVSSGTFAGAETEGPEYETIYAFGSALENSNFESIIYADKLCDQLGMDTIASGITIAFAMECYEKRVLTKADADGLDLSFGNAQVIPILLNKMAKREGIGDLMADGVREMARRLGKGTEKFAMHAKGMELGGYDPRGIRAQALVLACGPRGGCHHGGGYVITDELVSGRYDRFSVKGKAALTKRARDFRLIMDSALYCAFVGGSACSVDTAAQMIAAATGFDISSEELMIIGERASNVERAYNVREGIRRDDDTLPERLLKEPLPDGLSKGSILGKDFEQLIDEFYEVCGWNKVTGIPTKETLKRLGLVEMVGDIIELS